MYGLADWTESALDRGGLECSRREEAIFCMNGFFYCVYFGEETRA